MLGAVDVAEAGGLAASGRSRARPCRRPPGSPSRCRGWPAGPSWPGSGRSSMPPTASTTLDEAAEADLDVVVDPDAGLVLEGAHQQLRAAEGVRRVDLGRRRARASRTIESRGIDISRLGPDPVCSSMIVSVRCPTSPPVPSSWRSSSVRSSRESLPTRRYVVPACSVGALAVGLGVDLVDLAPRPERHRDQEDQPDQEHPLDHPEAEARAGAAGPPGWRGRSRAARGSGRRAAGGGWPLPEPRAAAPASPGSGRAAGCRPWGPPGSRRRPGARLSRPCRRASSYSGVPSSGPPLPRGRFFMRTDATVRGCATSHPRPRRTRGCRWR